MVWLALGLVLGYAIGKLEAIVRVGRWIKRLSPWDQAAVKSLLKHGTRCDENSAFDRIPH